MSGIGAGTPPGDGAIPRTWVCRRELSHVAPTSPTGKFTGLSLYLPTGWRAYGAPVAGSGARRGWTVDHTWESRAVTVGRGFRTCDHAPLSMQRCAGASLEQRASARSSTLRAMFVKVRAERRERVRNAHGGQKNTQGMVDSHVTTVL